MKLPQKTNEDVVVPVNTLPQFLDNVTQLSTHYKINNVNFGHAGNGNIHVNLLINPDDPMTKLVVLHVVDKFLI